MKLRLDKVVIQQGKEAVLLIPSGDSVSRVKFVPFVQFWHLLIPCVLGNRTSGGHCTEQIAKG